MSISSEIKEVAAKLARQMQGRVFRLQSELTEIEARKADIQAQLNMARLSPERASRFQPQIGPYFQCPRCWVENEKRSPLTPIGGPTRSEDFFRCRICGFEVTHSVLTRHQS